jgi:hypothetical protein
MIAEAREAGFELPGDADADFEMWDLWKQRQKFRNKKDRVMMNRFQMCIDRADKEFKGRQEPRLRLFMDGEVEPLQAIACNNAFWLMPESDIEELAEYFEIALPRGSSLITSMVLLITSVLKCDEEQALKYISVRLSHLANDTQFSEALLEFDEAIYCLDIHDHQEMQTTQKTAYNKLCDSKAFSEEFAVERQKRAAGKARAKAKGKAARGRQLPQAIPLHMEQSKVKDYIPPQSSCWRCNTRSEWWCHVHPFSKRIVCKLKDYNNDEHLTI